MDQQQPIIKPVKVGRPVSKKVLYRAIKKDVRPQALMHVLKETKLNAQSVGKYSWDSAKKMVKKLKEEDVLKTQIDNIGTHNATEKHLLKEMVTQGSVDNNVDKVNEADKKSVAERFARSNKRMSEEGFGRQITKHQQEALTEREATKKRNIEVVKAEHIVEAGAEELTTGYSSESKPSQPIHPSFGHAAPETAKPGQPTKSKKTTLGNPSQAIDIFN
jgi:hypothetical protein